MPAASTSATLSLPIHIPTDIISEIVDELESVYFNEPVFDYISRPQHEQEAVSIREFLAYRLVSLSFMDDITPRVFKVVRLSQNQRQIDKFWSLFGDGKHTLGRHVRELIYQDSEGPLEREIEATLSNLHLFPNLDTAQIFFHCYGLSAGDEAYKAAEDHQQTNQHLLESLSFAYRRELFVLYSLFNTANISIKPSPSLWPLSAA
ncbi:hypothetical protein M413DRAFT_119359 [Hebeloma cylindrosporum]|uniref:Uncharacterized protein n=1 Tax=Hebeloma cylindrosporum TaxID=76867 RepID=A0A0C2Z9X8_HEBCY|nr:hypothetical protein M413DRAFT_119359 [Hebeloma cylindrosporum h7]